jgi:glycosyltransferase involved in cell wall biosynthesis
MPTYNRANGYLREALDSALAQTYPNLEIVISDNGSTDNTESVVRSYADPRIRYYRQQPPIISNDNFNFCLQQANGAYFTDATRRRQDRS